MIESKQCMVPISIKNGCKRSKSDEKWIAYTQKLCVKLGYPTEFATEIYYVSNKVREYIKPGKRSRNLENLIPIFMYRTFKRKGMNIKLVDFMEKLDKLHYNMSDFKNILKETWTYLHPLNLDDKKWKAIEKIRDLCKQGIINPAISARAMRIISYNDEKIFQTIHNVALGAAISLSIISLGKRMELPPSKIAKIVNASPSSINYKMKQLLADVGIFYSKLKELDKKLPENFIKLVGN